MLDLDQLDPDWELAKIHGHACKAGIKPQKPSGNDSVLMCQCCFQVVYKDQVSLCQNSKEIEFLGFGYPLFYVFLKNCIMLLLITVCCYNVIELKRAISYNISYCNKYDAHHRLLASQNTPCESWMVQFSSIQQGVESDQTILRMASFVIHFVFLVYMRDNLIKLQAYYDERTTSLSDYTVMIKNIPKVKETQKKIKDFFMNEFSKPHEIMKMILLPEYPEFEQLQRHKHEIIEEMRKMYNMKDFNQSMEEFKEKKNQLLMLEDEIDDQILRDMEKYIRDQFFTEKALLIFNTDEEKQEVILQFNQIENSKKGRYFGIQSQNMMIKQAPEPKEILWENINVQRSKKIFLYILGWGLSFLTLVFVTIAVYFMLVAKTHNLLDALKKLDQDPNDKDALEEKNGAITLVYVIIFLIVLWNKLIMVVLFHKFTDLERHDSSSKFQFSFGLKYCLGLFFTTAIMTLAVEAIRFNNYYSHSFGVIEQETIMFFTNAFFVPFFWLVNPFHLIKLCKRKLNVGKRSLTQGQAHLLMEDTEYDMGKRYAQIIQTMWFTFLYATLIPIGAFISMIGLCLYYWIDKYNLLRRSSLKTEVSGRLVFTSLNLLDFTLVLRPIGALMFDKQVRSQFHASTIVMLVLSFIYLILPKLWIFRKIFGEKFYLQEKTYTQMQQFFKDTYGSNHPILKMAHHAKHISKLKSHGVSVENHSLFSQPLKRISKLDDMSHLEIKPSFINNQSSRNQIIMESSSPSPTKRKRNQRLM